ncbi:uncharacterized protein CCOS01_13410 [Colletotrichum costaricense]|uniref:2-dehydropantoate 2-reductase n=1 Tax=Colletotrichum costaricense TaxID=1209916 RepID=A0AAI9YLC9_9PEZI|nr:uncharacterized protein CCOS01_13410 [Colletotrichum costaricense]KAK1515217.1 hypothetical protein CCOS01_13410 [Colletotrichum costaricense]
MSEAANVLVVGCGAVGTMCAYALHKSKAATVTGVFRSNFEEVQRLGLCIRSVDHGTVLDWKPHHVERNISDAARHGPFDYVLVAMKSLPDIYSIPDLIALAVTPGRTSIVLVQNGIDIEWPFVDAFPENVVLSGVTMIGCELNGREVLHNDPDKLHLAPFPSPGLHRRRQEDACSTFAALYTLGGVACEIHEDIVRRRWMKLVWNASFNPVCAITGLDSGAVQAAGYIDTLVRPVMDEVVAIAEAAGYGLQPGIQDEMISFTPEAIGLKPSMQVDAMMDRPMEVEVILGNPLRIAQELKVEAPVLTILCNLLRARQWKYKQRT